MLVMESSRHGGCYEHYNYYLDMDKPCPTIFADFYNTNRRDFYPADKRMDTVHGSRTVTGMIPFADPWSLRAHDAYHRFFPDARWCMAKLWQILTTMLVQRFCRTGVITLALDDTLFHHSGRKVDGAGWWRDAVLLPKRASFTHGDSILWFSPCRYSRPGGGEPLGLPVNMRLHRKNGPTLIELAMEMINEVRQWLPKRSYRVVGDGFYATLAGKDLDGVVIISRIKRNANIFDLPPKQKKERTRSSPHQRQETRQAGKDGCPYPDLGKGYIPPARQNHRAAGLYSNSSLVQGQPQTDPAGYQSRPRQKREGRFSFSPRI